MNEPKEFEINIETLFPSFKEHLDLNGNNRISFSGKFGIGKTYFLNKFFEKNKDNYEVFHLFPVNYQISSNENIIDFLKYDILIELMKNEDIFKKDNKEDIGMIGYIKENFNTNSFLKNTVANLIDPIPQIGKILGKPLKTTLEFDKKFQEFKKGDSGIVEQFLKENNTETDCLSQILKNKIEKLTGENGNKKESVLILDDLERIDPEHIFRVLNIFSAHLNSESEEIPNKFGFDKIVIVGDIQNFKSIFHCRYGEETDFNGYFDKFFSFGIFPFQNEKIIEDIIDKIISNFQIAEKDNYYKEAIVTKNGYIKIILKDILLKALKLKKLNLRQLLRGLKFEILTLKKENTKEDMFFKLKKLVFINISIKILISLFNGLEMDLKNVLEKIKESNNNNKNLSPLSSILFDEFSYDLLMFIDKNKKSGVVTLGNYSLDVNSENRTIDNFSYLNPRKEDKILAPKEKNNKIKSEIFYYLLSEYVEMELYK